MSRHTVACHFETDELFGEMNAVRRKRREERLLQISAVKANARYIREIGRHAPDGFVVITGIGESRQRRRRTTGLSHAAPMTQHNLRLPGKLRAPSGVGSSDFRQAATTSQSS
jgi:hypothetical protein